jgi:hypothetical protein
MHRIKYCRVQFYPVRTGSREKVEKAINLLIKQLSDSNKMFTPFTLAMDLMALVAVARFLA